MTFDLSSIGPTSRGVVSLVIAVAALALVGCRSDTDTDSDTQDGVVVVVEVNGAGEIQWSVDGKQQKPCIRHENDPVSDVLCLDVVFSPTATVKLTASPAAGSTFTGWSYMPQHHGDEDDGGCSGSEVDVTFRPHPKTGTCTANFTAAPP